MLAWAASALVASALLLAFPARADDESAGVAPGAFRAEPAGAVFGLAAQVSLDGEWIEVVTELRASAPGALLRLVLPRFGWLGAGETYPDRHFPELVVTLDGQAVAPTDNYTVRAGGKDVTALVRAAGLDPYAVAETPPFVQAGQNRQPALDALLAARAVTRAPEGLLAGWTVQRQIGLALPAGRHRVSLRYKARPSLALAGTPLRPGAVRWAEYCLTPAAGAGLRPRGSTGGAVLVRTTAVPVAVSGAPPSRIGLTVSDRRDGSLSVMCSADGRAVVNPGAGQAMKAGPDGAVHVLTIGPPG